MIYVYEFWTLLWTLDIVMDYAIIIWTMDIMDIIMIDYVIITWIMDFGHYYDVVMYFLHNDYDVVIFFHTMIMILLCIVSSPSSPLPLPSTYIFYPFTKL